MPKSLLVLLLTEEHVEGIGPPSKSKSLTTGIAILNVYYNIHADIILLYQHGHSN